MDIFFVRSIAGSGIQSVWLAAALVFAQHVHAAESCTSPAGHVASIEGRVEVRPAGTDQWWPADRQISLCPGDMVAARSRSRATVILGNDVLARVSENTVFTVEAPTGSGSGLNISQGAVNVFSRNSTDVTVTTPHVAAQGKSGEFQVATSTDTSRVTVIEGRVHAYRPDGTPLVAAGAGEEGARDIAALPIEVQPADAARWAIHYPLIVSTPSARIDSLPEAVREDARSAMEEGLAGNYLTAVTILESSPGAESSPLLQAYRANMLLAIGRFDEARHIVTALDPQRDANASAIQAIVWVATNNAEGALASAKHAVSLDPQSPVAQLALSYAWQGQRDLLRALAAASRATELDPHNALAWARRAEVELVMAQREAAQISLDHALALERDLPLARALQGFVVLLGGDTDKAVEVFDAAIQHNSAEPQAWYGRGMAKIRQGRADKGLRDLEVAVTLDPTNAELRAYLARAYANTKHIEAAVSENELARRLDPLSPTPWYFEALRRQDANDPVGALAAAHEAEVRNDNRAVLRPASLLDQDNATREANMSKSYEAMGWYAAMTRVAQEAVTRDPQSGSAHQFLASAYANGGPSETARLSELLQAQLRQEPGQWPLPPQYYIAGLPILDGPRALSTEETSDLFERQPNHFAVSGMGGNNGTAGGSVLASHAWQSGQISAGYFDYRTDGWQAGSDFRTNAAQLDILQRIGERTTIYGQIRHSERDSGDLFQALATDAPGASATRRSQDSDAVQIGFRYDESSNAQWLGNAGYIRSRNRYSQSQQLPFGAFTVESDGPTNGRYAELQYLRNWVRNSLQLGGGTYAQSLRSDSVQTFSYVMLSRPIVTNTTTSSKGSYDNAYAIWQGNVSDVWSLYGGLSYDNLDAPGHYSYGKWNPKLGIAFSPTRDLTFRAAGFKTLASYQTQQQTLVPTTFNGFADVFDDLAGTRSSRIALAADQKFGSSGRAGIEISARSLDVPESGCDDNSCTADWSERAHRAYVSWAPLNWLSLSAEWRYDSVNRPVKFAVATLSYSSPTRIRTQQIPLRAWFRMGHQWSSMLEVRQVRQDVLSWVDRANVLTSENFWITNIRLRQNLDGDRLWWEIMVGNLFDKHFRYQDATYTGDIRTPEFLPGRVFSLRVNARW